MHERNPHERFTSTLANILRFGKRAPMQGQLVTRLTALDGLQDEPGGHRAGFAVQAPWSGRRASSTVATGDEVPMNPHEMHEDG